MNPLPQPAGDTACHAVYFSRDPAELSGVVARFLADGLEGGQPALIVARPQLRRAVEATLPTHGIDVAASKAAAQLVLLDARQVLDAFLVEGHPDPCLFQQTIDAVFGPVHQTRGRRIRVYGEMVDLLWQANQRLAALELEECWNALAASHDFELLCGYSTGREWEDSTVNDIRLFHSHVMLGSGDLAAIS